MANFFKGLAKGVLYFFFFPFGLLAIALYGIFGIVVFFIQFIKLIVLFFSGRSLQSDLPEDIQVKKIKEKDQPKEEEETKPAMSLYPSDSIVYGSGYSSPIEKSEEKKPEEPVNDIAEEAEQPSEEAEETIEREEEQDA